jgi:gluconolactonase
VIDGKSAIHGRVFDIIDAGVPDGFRLDINGYLYTSSADSIQVYNPEGQLLGKIMVPEVVANCTFGGPLKNRLFIAATSSIYAITLNTCRVQKP